MLEFDEFYLYGLEEDLLHEYDSLMKLKIFVDSNDEELKNKYADAAYNHNLKLRNNIKHIDAGFDLFTPNEYLFSRQFVNKLDYQIVCSARTIRQLHDSRKENNTGFYMYPRSSISKTYLRLANNVGIIDAGYRGHLIGMFDTDHPSININKFDRHLQICAPGLIPIVVELVSSIEELGDLTARGDGGFGSTGI
jgi:dUTP pyrophosphatase